MCSKQRKIVILGCPYVGKSSLAIQYLQGQFLEYYEPTVENTFRKITKIDGQDYFLNIVDAGGQNEYSIFPPSYSMDIHGYILMYSITSSRSFDIVQHVHTQLLDMTGKMHVPIVLVGNKVDLHVDREVTYEEGKRLADSMQASFLEVSAKYNDGVRSVFKTILAEIDRAGENFPVLREDEGSGCQIS